LRSKYFIVVEIQAIAANQLRKEGIEVSAGQTIKYLITDAENKRPDRRVKAAQLIYKDTRYDKKKYLELMLSAAANILSPFNFTEEKIRNIVITKEKQLQIN
jgi:DNA polymerase elongation subunit (family B)